jgi:hypothetical protein
MDVLSTYYRNCFLNDEDILMGGKGNLSLNRLVWTTYIVLVCY